MPDGDGIEGRTRDKATALSKCRDCRGDMSPWRAVNVREPLAMRDLIAICADLDHLSHGMSRTRVLPEWQPACPAQHRIE